MRLTNYMEKAAREAVDDILKSDRATCRCGRCKLDMTALVLNQLPSKYAVREKGLVFAKLNELEIQFKVDLTVAATKARDKVRKFPRH